LDVDRETEERGEPHRAQHAEGILGEALARLADRADDPGLEIALPPERGDELARFSGRGPWARSDVDWRPPGHGVHREVATCEVLAKAPRQAHVIGTPMVGVIGLVPRA